ncbi:MAG TPA: hypothetical protein VMN36_13965 [Verrucomicrobiales bacterium]|nr:hypothetical protein [Verrucomicrobiales bacterium]
MPNLLLFRGPIFLWIILTGAASAVAAPSGREPGRRQDAPPPTGPARIAGLIPLGRPVERVRIPSFTEEGLQASVLEAEMVTRIDDDTLSIEDLRIVLFNAEGKSDIRIGAPYADYLLQGELLSTPYPVTITKQDYFAARGSGLVFDYGTQQACLLGPVVMVLDDHRRPRSQKDSSDPSKPGSDSRPGPESALPPVLAPEELLAAAGSSLPASSLAGLPVSVPARLPLTELQTILARTQAAFKAIQLMDSRLEILQAASPRDVFRRKRLDAALAAHLPTPAIPTQTAPPRARTVDSPDQDPGDRSDEAFPSDELLSSPPAKAKPDGVFRFVTIRCSGRTVVDFEKFVVVYQEDVILEHPEFRLTCDELVVYRGEGDSEIKKAVATGRMVVIQRRNPAGVLEEARCRKAVFENDQLVLLEYPQIRRDRVLHRATSSRTKLVIPRKGDFRFDGPSETIGADKADEADARNP